MARNLIKNPCGEDGIDFWELIENGGSMWKVEDVPGDCGHAHCDENITKYFVTSFDFIFQATDLKNGKQWDDSQVQFEGYADSEYPGDAAPHNQFSSSSNTLQHLIYRLCLKRQLVDLVQEGYSTEELDAMPPVTVKDWYSGRTDCGCTYQLTVCLLDENQEVIQEFKPDEVTLELGSDCSWKEVSHTFRDYSPGLRFILFQHGGQDTSFWQGWYGVRVTGSSVTIEL